MQTLPTNISNCKTFQLFEENGNDVELVRRPFNIEMVTFSIYNSMKIFIFYENFLYWDIIRIIAGIMFFDSRKFWGTEFQGGALNFFRVSMCLVGFQK